MAITIAHLYYDILNLYGESGNIKILKYALEKSGYKVIIKFVTVDDILEFDTYDLVYMGMGIPENFNIVIKHLKKYKKDLVLVVILLKIQIFKYLLLYYKKRKPTPSIK